MKKLYTVSLCLWIVIFLFAGCSGNQPLSKTEPPENTELENVQPTEDQKNDTDHILMTALEGHYPVLSQSGQYEKLPEYLAQQYYAVATAYAYVDFNNDGNNEMVVQTDLEEVACILLYYSGEDVFFFSFDSGHMKHIKSDGSFVGGGTSQLTYAKLDFVSGGYRLENQATGDYEAGTYNVNGMSCNEKTFADFEKNWALKESVSWVDLEFQSIQRPEESLPETEPAEPTEVDDGSYRLNIPRMDQPIYSGPGYHYNYVGNIGIAGIYTIVEEYRDSNNILWGKLKSGIGWVDLNDVHRSDKPITIDYADPDLLASGNFHNCDKNAGAHSIAVAFRAHETLFNVQIFYNTYDYDYDIESGYDLFYLKKLTPDKPIVAAISFTDTSVYLISFEDSYGNFYMYEFYESGYGVDGWCEIVEVER